MLPPERVASGSTSHKLIRPSGYRPQDAPPALRVRDVGEQPRLGLARPQVGWRLLQSDLDQRRASSLPTIPSLPLIPLGGVPGSLGPDSRRDRSALRPRPPLHHLFKRGRRTHDTFPFHLRSKMRQFGSRHLQSPFPPLRQVPFWTRTCLAFHQLQSQTRCSVSGSIYQMINHNPSSQYRSVCTPV